MLTLPVAQRKRVLRRKYTPRASMNIPRKCRKTFVSIAAAAVVLPVEDVSASSNYLRSSSLRCVSSLSK